MLLAAMTACGSESNSAPNTDATTTSTVPPSTVASTLPTTTASEPTFTLTADVTEGLVDQQTVSVTSSNGTGAGWLVQCDSEDLSVCWTGTPEMFDTFGTFVDGIAVIEVRRFIDGVDCAERPGRCVLRLAAGDEVALVPGSPMVELSFAPDAETRSALQLTVTPAVGLVDRQELTIEIANFPDTENRGLRIERCTTEATPRCAWVVIGDEPVVDGVIEFTTAMPRWLIDPAGEFAPVDCALTPCVIRVSYPGSPVAEAALGFDATQPAPDLPMLQVLPTADPRTFRVTGQGLTYGIGLTIMVCVGGAADVRADDPADRGP